MSDVREGPETSIPRVPLLLGLSGLLPFWGLALALFVPQLVPWSRAASGTALAAYGAIIVSFLGGIRWGLAVAASDQRNTGMHYAVSVLPSLAAWVLLIPADPWRLSGLGVLALALGPIDVGLVSSRLAPAWFGRLRMVLSGGAGAALLVAASAAVLRP